MVCIKANSQCYDQGKVMQMYTAAHGDVLDHQDVNERDFGLEKFRKEVC